MRNWKDVFRRGIFPNFFTISKSYFDCFDNGLIYFNGKILSVYADADEINRKTEEIIKTYTDDFYKFEKERDKVIKLYENSAKWAKNIRKRGFDNLSDDEIISVLEELKQRHQKIGRSIWYFHFFLESELRNYLKKTYSPLVAMSISTAITAPAETTSSRYGEKKVYELVKEIEEEGWLKNLEKYIEDGLSTFIGSYWMMEFEVRNLIIKYLKKNGEIKRKIRKYILDWGYLYGEYGSSEFLDKNLIENPEETKFGNKIYNKIATIILKENPLFKIKLMDEDNKRIKRVKELYLKEELHLADDDLYYKYAEILSWASFVRMRRRETITQIDYYIAPLLKKVVINYDRNLENDVRFLEIDDIINIAKGIKDDYKTKIEKIKRGWLWVKHNGESKVFMEGEAEDIFRREMGIVLPPKKMELKGIVRYFPSNGEKIYRGPARIIIFSNDLKRNRDGDIVISLMIHPNYLISIEEYEYLSKAKAIITEEGTFTCHLLVAFAEMAHKFRSDLLLITDAKNTIELIKEGNTVEINLENILPTGEVVLEVKE